MVVLKKFVVICLLTILLGTMAMDYAVSYAGDMSAWNGQMNNTEAIAPTKSFLRNILGVVRTVGMIIAVVMLIVVACKYMLAAPSDRADLKKYLQIYIVGALVLFGAAGLVSIIQKITDDALDG